MLKLTGGMLHATSLPVLSAQLCDMRPPLPGTSKFGRVHIIRSTPGKFPDAVDLDMPAVTNHSERLMAFNVDAVRKVCWSFANDTVRVGVQLGQHSIYDLILEVDDGVEELPEELSGLAHRLIPNDKLVLESNDARLHGELLQLINATPHRAHIVVRNLASA